jgi:hypothetical protein
MSATWLPTRELREATQQAMQRFYRQHPKRRAADFDADAFELDMCQAFASVPLAAVPLVADQAIEAAHGNYPSPWEVKQAAKAFLRRTAPTADVVTPGLRPMAPDPIADAQLAQARAMLRGMKLDGPEVGRVSQMLAISTMTDAILAYIRKRIAAGLEPASRIEEFRDGAWPPIDALERRAARITAEGDTAVSAFVQKATAMLTGEAA